MVSPSIPHSSRSFLVTTLRPHRWRIAGLFLILLAGIAISVITPIIASAFIDGVIGTATYRYLLALALGTIALALISQGIALVETWMAESLSWDTTNAVRLRLISHVLGLDISVHTSQAVGALIDRVDGDVSMMARFLSRYIVVVVGNAHLILAILAVMITRNTAIGLILTATVLITFLLLGSIRRRATPLWQKERQASANWYGELSEHLDGLEDIQAAGAAPWVLRQNTLATRAWYAITMKAQVMGYSMVSVTVLLFGFGSALVLGLAANQALNGTMTIGEVYLVFSYTLMLRTPIEQIRNELQDVQQADASVRRVVDLLNQQSRLPDTGSHDLPTGKQPIRLEHVTFGWNPEIPVLHDVSLTFPAGRVTGIVGRTGSGKTTLTRLICRMIDPDKGAVMVGDIDLRDVPLDQLRARIAVMSQDVRIVHATLRDNLTWFNPTYGDDRLVALLHEVGMEEWYTRLPEGLNTLLGHGGLPLSAGEAQLIACTRILLHDPDIVILDEASSRLDPATERTLHRASARILHGRTAIVIAHRLESMLIADEIVVLEQGRVVEHGDRVVLMTDPESHLSHLLAHTNMEVDR
ncbi:MAG: ABC transporter ATP-binding protein/permease [Thermomicrobiales bacterium]|nr:ABC transporter ATP-binding protein/permease [Thermomicrobiales bacterium]